MTLSGWNELAVGSASAPAPFSPAVERSHMLKHGDTFAVLDRFGEISPAGLGQYGIYHQGTRFLSCSKLELDGERPVLLRSTVRCASSELDVSLTNPDRLEEGRITLPVGTLRLVLKIFLWRGVAYQRVHVENHGMERVKTTLSLQFAADFADILEVRGPRRRAHGRQLEPDVGTDCLMLGYEGLDGVTRRTRIELEPHPCELSAGRVVFRLSLPPRGDSTLQLRIVCDEGRRDGELVAGLDTARAAAAAERKRSAWSCQVRTSSRLSNGWLSRAESDVSTLTTELPSGPYPYAGLPWFNTPFGRDAIITALECLWVRPELARGVLAYLADTQATDILPARDAEPGKILHETRCGELAALNQTPFALYYGTADATPLFVMLAGAYYERTGDLGFVNSIWPKIEAALGWIARYGDRDGDGFVEYDSSAPDGLIHQGWKDSNEAIFHADGSAATGPIALCEIQGYVYAARRAAAMLAGALGRTEHWARLEREAEVLRSKFEQEFWCEELSTYALALDGRKRPCRVRASNAGHCLFTGIASREHASRLARQLMSPDSHSGFGIRTLASSERAFNPMGYHVGGVWPHDNALIAQGLSRYGFTDAALVLADGLLEAALSLEGSRMPELFCGFARTLEDGPLPHPLACAPQAWSAGAVFLLLQACLGLRIDGIERRVHLTRPQLPAMMPELRILDLAVGGATVDLLLVRHEHHVAVQVLRRQGGVRVLVES